MQNGLNFSKALVRNIERTYTYSYAVNTLGHIGEPNEYDPMEAFIDRVHKDPFTAFMALDRYSYKNTLNALNRYNIPYAPEQERKARVKFEVTELMKQDRSDTVFVYIDDLDDTGVVNIGEEDGTFELTTEETIYVSDFINCLNANHMTSNVFYKNKLKHKLSKQQEEAVENSLTHQYSCLIGGAGTGKSYVTSALIDQLKANGRQVAILAPTHKAREALQEKLSDGVGDVRTIHSYVHSNYGRDDIDVIVIDEAGMISTPLMLRLINAYKEGQQLIFVGDKNQLEPIEYGRPFELLMKCLSTYELTENWRAESKDIISLAHELLGKTVNKNLAMNNIYLVDTIEEAFDEGAEVLLTFMNKQVSEANEAQRLKNSDKAISDNFSIGDKIIAKTNNAPYYFNGQLFELTHFNKAKNIKSDQEITFDTWQDLAYNFDLAYGLTIHKSQGSEWDTVAYMPSDYDTQNLAYVAVTRAKQKLIIVGSMPDPSKLRPPKEWKHY